MRYKKTDIETHKRGYYGKAYPAVNVKVYKFPYVSILAKELSCTIEEAEKAAKIAFESACEVFWEYIAADHVMYYCFGKAVKYYSAGRSSGWLIVTGLDDIEKWDAIMVAKWARFERDIKAEVDYLTSEDQIVESIRSNGWFTPIAETGDALQVE